MNDMQGTLSPAEAAQAPERPLAELEIQYRIGGRVVDETLSVYGARYKFPGEPDTLFIDRVVMGGVDITEIWNGHDEFRAAVLDHMRGKR
jgi:hypothetical protein